MKRLPVAVAASLGGIVLLVAGVVDAATISPLDSGEVVIVVADDPSKALTSGDGTTPFLVRMPDGAVCPGDSFNDQWRIQSFMVSSETDVGTLSYGVIGPEGPQQLALFGADPAASSFANILTPANAVAGQPGSINTPPPFSLAVAAGELIPSGGYRIGIACTYFGATALYWDTEIEVTRAATGEPSDLSWTLPGLAAEPKKTDDDSGKLPVFVVVIGAVATGGFMFSRNVPKNSNSRSKEPK